MWRVFLYTISGYGFCGDIAPPTFMLFEYFFEWLTRVNQFITLFSFEISFASSSFKFWQSCKILTPLFYCNGLIDLFAFEVLFTVPTTFFLCAAIRYPLRISMSVSLSCGMQLFVLLSNRLVRTVQLHSGMSLVHLLYLRSYSVSVSVLCRSLPLIQDLLDPGDFWFSPVRLSWRLLPSARNSAMSPCRTTHADARHHRQESTETATVVAPSATRSVSSSFGDCTSRMEFAAAEYQSNRQRNKSKKLSSLRNSKCVSLHSGKRSDVSHLHDELEKNSCPIFCNYGSFLSYTDAQYVQVSSFISSIVAL